jgi:hypothetical protein
MGFTPAEDVRRILDELLAIDPGGPRRCLPGRTVPWLLTTSTMNPAYCTSEVPAVLVSILRMCQLGRPRHRLLVTRHAR